jgi:TonB family protein
MIWWQYLLLVNIYLVLFYAFYVLLLQRETFFQLNRIYLVTAALLSFFIPVIQANWVQNLFITQQVKYTIYSIPVMEYQFKPIAESHFKLGELFALLYLSGILVLSAKLTWQLFKLKKVLSMPKSTVPYSFFKTVKLDESNPDNAIIEAHEQVHAQQWHSADVLLIEMVMIINWFNPVVYFYRFAIKHIHEFIADRQAVQAGTNKADYALLLLKQTFNAPTHQLVNPFFNHSLLKKRIIMLQKNKSQRIWLIKYGLSAPLFILMLILSSATINKSQTVSTINSKADEIFRTPAGQVNLSLARVIENIKPVAADDTAEIRNEADTTSDAVFSSVEILPEFPGGVEAFGKFLGSNIRYPAAAREKHIQGRVICTFIVEKNGRLSNIRVVRSISPDIDAEAVRVLNMSPTWKAGVQNNHKVRTQYSVPISFTLDNSDKLTGKNNTTDPPPVVEQLPPNSNGVLSSVEHLPEFPGGVEAFGKFLGSHVRYPKDAREKGIQGRVIITFVVEKDGSLSGYKISRGVSPDIDAEALRVLKMSPTWSPGTQKGKPVRVQYSVPISFTLADDKKPANKTGAVQTPRQDNTPSSTGVETTGDTLNGHVAGKAEYKGLLLTDKKGNVAQPLYLLNGKEITEDKMKGVDVNTIESISVLKDKSAISLYGDKGLNGVVMITTKK